MTAPDLWIETLARMFREHPAWQETARLIDPRSTSTVYFRHRPDEPWHLERRGMSSIQHLASKMRQIDHAGWAEQSRRAAPAEGSGAAAEDSDAAYESVATPVR